MIILKGGTGYLFLYSMPAGPEGGFESCCLAKFLTLSRTMLIPRSSEALSSRTREPMSSGPYSSLANARMVLVFPVPGGP